MENKPLDVVKFTPYRGTIEPVTKVHAADINFYANLIEVILHYDYIQVADSVKTDERVRFAEMFPRGTFSVSIASIAHEQDEEDERVPAIFISASQPNQVVIRCRKQKEAEEVYQKLKKWMIS